MNQNFYNLLNSFSRNTSRVTNITHGNAFLNNVKSFNSSKKYDTTCMCEGAGLTFAISSLFFAIMIGKDLVPAEQNLLGSFLGSVAQNLTTMAAGTIGWNLLCNDDTTQCCDICSNINENIEKENIEK